MKYVIFGFILGAVLAVAVLLLKYVLSDRLRSKGELLAAELPVLGEFHVGKGYRPSLERSLMDIALLAEKSGNSSKVFLNVLSDGADCRKAAEEYRDEMTRNDLQSELGYSAGEDAGELKRMIAAGNCVFVVEFGKTGFKQLEEQRGLCQKGRVLFYFAKGQHLCTGNDLQRPQGFLTPGKKKRKAFGKIIRSTFTQLHGAF